MSKFKKGDRGKQPEQKKLPIHLFSCNDCKDKGDMEFKEFKEHLLNTHSISDEGLQGTKQMMMHLDFADSFSSTYEWTLESGLKFQEYYEGERAQDDLMRKMK